MIKLGKKTINFIINKIFNKFTNNPKPNITNDSYNTLIVGVAIGYTIGKSNKY